MKRLLIFTLALILAATAGAAESKRAKHVARLQTCESILQRFTDGAARMIPPDVLRNAKGIVIVNQVQIGLILGIKDGWGAALVKKPGGRWSVPVFIKAGEMSFGLQAGGKTVETVFVIMDEPTARLLFKPRVNFGVDAKAVAGPSAAEAEKNTGGFRNQVYVYSNAVGLYAGATIKTGSLSTDLPATQQFYHTEYGTPEILYSDWIVPPSESQPIMNHLQRLSP